MNSDDNKKIVENNENNESKKDISLTSIQDISVPKKRGRKPKVKTEEELLNLQNVVKKKRGRKPSGKIFEVDENSGSISVPECIMTHLQITDKDIRKITGEEKKQTIVKKDSNVVVSKKQINFDFESSDDLKHSLNEKCHEFSQLKKKYDDLESRYQKYSYLETIVADNGVVDRKYHIPSESMIDENNEKWKISTKQWCTWCVHPFDTIPVGLPETYCTKEKKFHTRDCFCSFNCAHAYNLSLNDYKVWERYSLLSRMKNIIYQNNDNKFADKAITYAPPRKILKVFNGTETIEEFRNNSISIPKEYHSLLPPMIPIFNVIEEIPKFFYQNKTNSNFNNLKVKRSKPLPIKNNNLMSLLTLS